MHNEAKISIHQCAQFRANPELLHDQAVKKILKYLKDNAMQVLILNPYLEKGIYCYANTNFYEGYNKY